MEDEEEFSDTWSFSDEDEDGVPGAGAGTGTGGGTSNPERSNKISQFTAMGFAESLVVRVIDEIDAGEGNEDKILENLLSYQAIEESTPPHLPEKDKKLSELLEMGFNIDEASAAINACDPDTSTVDLMDRIYAAQIENPTSNHQDEQPLGIFEVNAPPNGKKKKFFEQENQWERELGCRSNAMIEREKRIKIEEGETATNILKPALWRRLPDAAATGSAPYFYFENGGFHPKNVCSSTISSFLLNFEPEIVDLKSFCAVATRRGYIHNLPTDRRFRLLPSSPLTIIQALPHTAQWWPRWDPRTQFNSLHTCNGSPKPTETIRKAFLSFQGDQPPPNTQKIILDECRRCNLVWTGPSRVSLLEHEEMEMLLGYPKCYTRGGGTRTDRYKALANAVQVDSIAFHLSVLKELFPSGISLLSLFPGIGGAEIALHRLGIPLKLVVFVENSEVNRKIFRSWWKGSEQKGDLIDDVTNVNMLTSQKLEELVGVYGGFDLIIGGSRCNDITGSNQRTGDYYQGNNSSDLFFEYSRILDKVKSLMGVH